CSREGANTVPGILLEVLEPGPLPHAANGFGGSGHVAESPPGDKARLGLGAGGFEGLLLQLEMVAQLTRDLLGRRCAASRQPRDDATHHDSPLRLRVHYGPDGAHQVIPPRLLSAQMAPAGGGEAVELELAV